MFHHSESQADATLKARATSEQDLSLKQCLDDACKIPGTLGKPVDVKGHNLPPLLITDKSATKPTEFKPFEIKPQDGKPHPYHGVITGGKDGLHPLDGKPVKPGMLVKPVDGKPEALVKPGAEKPGAFGKPGAEKPADKYSGIKPWFEKPHDGKPGVDVKPSNPVWDKPGMGHKPAQELIIKPKPGTADAVKTVYEKPGFKPGFEKPGFEKPGYEKPGIKPGFEKPGEKPGNYAVEMKPVSKEEWAKLLAMKLAEIQREKEAGLLDGGSKLGTADKGVTEKPNAHKTPKSEKVEEKN